MVKIIEWPKKKNFRENSRLETWPKYEGKMPGGHIRQKGKGSAYFKNVLDGLRKRNAAVKCHVRIARVWGVGGGGKGEQ